MYFSFKNEGCSIIVTIENKKNVTQEIDIISHLIILGKLSGGKCFDFSVLIEMGTNFRNLIFEHVQFSSVAQSCPTLCDPMNPSMLGLPVYHQLPEFTQTHVHRVTDAIQPSHPLSAPSPPAPNASWHQSLFQ